MQTKKELVIFLSFLKPILEAKGPSEKDDKMAQIISFVRDIMRMDNVQQLNMKEIMKKATKNNFSSVKFDKDDLLETVNYYKSLSVIFVDSDENIVFL